MMVAKCQGLIDDVKETYSSIVLAAVCFSFFVNRTDKAFLSPFKHAFCNLYLCKQLMESAYNIPFEGSLCFRRPLTVL